MPRKMIVALILVLAMGFAGTAWARSGKDGRSMQKRYCPMGAGPMCGLGRLDLTAQQWEKTAAILEKHKDEIRALHKKMWKAKKALRDATMSDTYNEKNIRAAAGNLAADIEETAILRAKVFSEIRAILTPQQIERMKNMRSQHRARMKAMWEYRELMGDDMMGGGMMHHGPMMHHRMMGGGMMQ